MQSSVAARTSASAVVRMRACAALGAVLSLAVWHLLTLHLVFPMPSPLLLLAALLAGIGLLLWGSARFARQIPAADRSRLARTCAGFDRETAAWVGLLFALLIAFHLGYTRASGDGREYFVQLRSALMDFDLDYANDMAQFGAHEPQTFPIGSAILWAPFFLACHAWLALVGLFTSGVLRNGYWNPYQMAIGLGSLAYGFTGLVLAHRLARKFVPFAASFLSIVGVTFGSFLIYYLAFEGSYTHADGFFAVTLFVYLWTQARDSVSLRRWIAIGAVGGLMIMVRWQNAIFFALPFLDTVPVYLTKQRGRMLAAHVVAGLTAIIVFLPQLAAFKVTNGGWLAVPHGQAGQQWWNDSLAVDILFSANHGLFTWSPLLYVAALGIPLLFRKEPRLSALLVVAFLLQAYVNGANSTWFGGSAFGGRRFDGCLVLFILSLAVLIETIRKQPLLLLVPLVAITALVNQLLIHDVTNGPLEVGQGVTFAEMFNSVYTRTGNPFSIPASLRFARQYNATPALYDRASKQWFTNVRIDVGGNDGAFLGGGWGAPEMDHDTSFRWALGPRSFVVAPIKSEIRVAPGHETKMDDYRLHFRAQPFTDRQLPEPWVEIVVNDVLVVRQPLAPEWTDYEVALPSRVLRRNLNRLELRYAYATSPAELGQSDDRRPLAVRFDTIDFMRESTE